MAHVGASFVVFCSMFGFHNQSQSRLVFLMASLIVWLLRPEQGFGQAAVTNGGFESFTNLPNASGQFNLVQGWLNGGSEVAMPDYYHDLGSEGGDLPQTPLAKVDAFQGRGIAGFVAYTDEPDPWHEYVTGRFSQPLIPGQRYKMSFAITSGRVHDWVSAGIGVSGLGVVLSTSPPAQQGYEPLEKLPQFVIHETLYDRNWRQMAFVFTATDAFSFFTFGLFDRDEIRLSREEGGERTMAYYFLDDFQIEEVESALMSEERPDRGTPGVALPDGVYIPNAFTPDGNQINDVWSLALPQGIEGEMVVFDRWGEQVVSQRVSQDQAEAWDGNNSLGEPCPPGIYGWRLMTNQPVEGQAEWKGWVTLTR